MLRGSRSAISSRSRLFPFPEVASSRIERSSAPSRFGEQRVQLAELGGSADEPRSVGVVRTSCIPTTRGDPIRRAADVVPSRGDPRGPRSPRRSALVGRFAGGDRGSRRGPAARRSPAPGRSWATRSAATGAARPRPRPRAAAIRSGNRAGRDRASRGPTPDRRARPPRRPVPVSGIQREPPDRRHSPRIRHASAVGSSVLGSTSQACPVAGSRMTFEGFTAPWTKPRPWIASRALSVSIATVRQVASGSGV